MSLVELYLLPKGRITRRSFWLQGVLVVIFIGLVGEQIDVLLDTQRQMSVLVETLLLWPILMLTIKRWHDRDKSGWWSLLWFLPFIGAIWTLIELGFVAGTPGPNRFGSPQTPTILESQRI